MRTRELWCRQFVYCGKIVHFSHVTNLEYARFKGCHVVELGLIAGRMTDMHCLYNKWRKAKIKTKESQPINSWNTFLCICKTTEKQLKNKGRTKESDHTFLCFSVLFFSRLFLCFKKTKIIRRSDFCYGIKNDWKYCNKQANWTN